MRTTALICVGIVVTCVGRSAAAQCDDKQLHKFLVGSAPTEETMVRLEGDTAVVAKANSAVHVFERTGGVWQQVAVFLSPGGGSDGFGKAIDLSGTRLVVGAPTALFSGQSNCGIVYVFERLAGVWTARPPIVPVAVSGQQFGAAVALSGNLVCVRKRPANMGRVDVFEHDGGSWTPTATLAPTDTPESEFGVQVDTDGLRIVVGSPSEQTQAGGGAVYVFENNGAWVESAKLVPGGVSAFGNFGRTVQIRGDRILASGAQQPTPNASFASAGFVFERFGVFWAQRATLVAPDLQAANDFGGDFILGDDLVCCPAPSGGAGGSPSGACWVYRRVGGVWQDVLKLVPDDPAVARNLGRSASVWGDEVLLSATQFPNQVTAYSFDTTPNPAPVFGAACAGSGGFLPSLTLKATYDGCFAAGDGVSFDLKNALGGSVCLFVLGYSTAQVPLPGGCSLWIVPSPANQALPLFGAGPGGGSVSFGATIPANFPPLSLYFQAFAVDSGVYQGYSATNGLRMTVH